MLNLHRMLMALPVFAVIYAITPAQARTVFLPDYEEEPIKFSCAGKGGGEDYCLCQRSTNPVYHYAPGAIKCSDPKIYAKTCPHSDDWITECYCPSEYNKVCTSPYRGVGKVCDGKYKECCDSSCPDGAKKNSCSHPYITERTLKNGCDETCYICRYGNDCNTSCGLDEDATPSGGTNDFNHQSCVTCSPKCTPLPNETGCSKTKECSDGCGGIRLCCDIPVCTPLPNETGCSKTKECSDGCGGTRLCCVPDPKPVSPEPEPVCTPKSNETGCSKTKECSDGCGGTRKCCDKSEPKKEPECTPKPDEKGCSKTKECSDGCGGKRRCCVSEPNCSGYSSAACGKFEKETLCPEDKTKRKCTATCLSTLYAIGEFKELDGQKVVQVPTQLNRIVVINDGMVSSLPNVIITSAREYLKNMGKNTSVCPNIKPTLTTSGGNPSGLRDLKVKLNGTFTGSFSLSSVALTLGSSSQIKGSSINLFEGSTITGGTSGTTPTLDMTGSLNLSSSTPKSSINVPSIRISGSSYSSAYGDITVKWLKLDNNATMSLFSSTLKASNQGTYDDVKKCTGTNCGSSIVVFNNAKLQANSGATISAPRIFTAYNGAVVASGGQVEAKADLWLGSYIKGNTNAQGLAGATSRGTFKTPEISMGHNSCLCLTSGAVFSSTADKGRYYDMTFSENRAFKAGTDNGKWKWVTHKDQDKFNDKSDKCKRYETEWHKTSCDYMCADLCKSKVFR